MLMNISLHSKEKEEVLVSDDLVVEESVDIKIEKVSIDDDVTREKLESIVEIEFPGYELGCYWQDFTEYAEF